MKERVRSIIRTLVAVSISVLLWFASHHVFVYFSPVIVFPIAMVYYYQSIIIYFRIVREDFVSIFIGLLVSICFIMLYIVKIGSAIFFLKFAFIIGMCLGVYETFRILSIKLRLTSYN